MVLLGFRANALQVVVYRFIGDPLQVVVKGFVGNPLQVVVKGFVGNPLQVVVNSVGCHPLQVVSVRMVFVHHVVGMCLAGLLCGEAVFQTILVIGDMALRHLRMILSES